MKSDIARKDLEDFVKHGNKEYEMGYTDSEIETMSYELLDSVADDVFYLDCK